MSTGGCGLPNYLHVVNIEVDEIMLWRFYIFISLCLAKQVLSESGGAKAVAFDEIDKAPEEKARGITIATVSNLSSRCDQILTCLVGCLGLAMTRGQHKI